MTLSMPPSRLACELWLSLANSDWCVIPSGEWPPSPEAKPDGGSIFSDGLFYLSLVTSAFWLWRMKGLRWRSASLLVLQQVVLVAAGFIAGMSVSGDWL